MSITVNYSTENPVYTAKDGSTDVEYWKNGYFTDDATGEYDVIQDDTNQYEDLDDDGTYELYGGSLYLVRPDYVTSFHAASGKEEGYEPDAYKNTASNRY